MRKLHVDDFVFQVATLVFSFLVVHVPYTLVVRPNAQAVLQEQEIGRASCRERV